MIEFLLGCLASVMLFAVIFFVLYGPIWITMKLFTGMTVSAKKSVRKIRRS